MPADGRWDLTRLLYKTQKVKIYMYQYFKRQLKTPTCFGSFGIHPQGVLKVFL